MDDEYRLSCYAPNCRYVAKAATFDAAVIRARAHVETHGVGDLAYMMLLMPFIVLLVLGRLAR